jgi:hypothetical protein
VQTDGSNMADPPFYRPAIFFRHLPLSALLFPQGKIRRSSKKYYSNLFNF